MTQITMTNPEFDDLLFSLYRAFAILSTETLVPIDPVADFIVAALALESRSQLSRMFEEVLFRSMKGGKYIVSIDHVMSPAEKSAWFQRSDQNKIYVYGFTARKFEMTKR